MRSIWQRIVQFDLWCEHLRTPIVLLALVVLLRIPTFFEPYWYGDEGIYLVIGEALNRGQVLYAQIIDHKTPLIYVFAQVGSQLNFRVLMMVWLVIATGVFIKIAKQLFTQKSSWVLATLGWIAAISLPSFEGTIPNGELFVIGFVLCGVLLILHTDLWRKPHSTKYSTADLYLFLTAGGFFSLGILTKVPAILDLFAWIGLLVISRFSAVATLFSDLRRKLMPTTRAVALLILGTSIPILLSILYFVLRGHWQPYLDYGLLYNFRYAGTWQPTFPHPFFSVLFSLPGKSLVLALAVGSTWILGKRLPKYWTVSLVWFWCTLFASLLSNRPYPHYFLQIVPPLALLLGSLAESLRAHVHTTQKLLVTSLLIPVAIVVAGIIALLDAHPYPTISYYSNWWRYVTNQQSLAAYNQWFNPLMSDNYQAAKLIRTQGNGELFIWGTNPMLYALSDTIPTGRFTVSFHIHDFAAYDETLQDLRSAQPPFIVTMDDERGTLPGLKQLLLSEYRMYRSFDHYDLWKRNATN